MKEYQHILVAIDVFIDYTAVLDRALAVAAEADTTKLSLAYITEPSIYGDAYLGDSQLAKRPRCARLRGRNWRKLGSGTVFLRNGSSSSQAEPLNCCMKLPASKKWT